MYIEICHFLAKRLKTIFPDAPMDDAEDVGAGDPAQASETATLEDGKLPSKL